MEDPNRPVFGFGSLSDCPTPAWEETKGGHGPHARIEREEHRSTGGKRPGACRFDLCTNKIKTPKPPISESLGLFLTKG